MKHIKRQFNFYAISSIDANTASLIKENIDSWYLIEDINKSVHNRNHTGGLSYRSFDTALVSATQQEKIIASSFIDWGGMLVSLNYLPKKEGWFIKVWDKQNLNVLVSDEYYAECMAELKAMKKEDRLYREKPKREDHYDTDNFTF